MYPATLRVILNYTDNSKIKKLLKGYTHEQRTYFERQIDKNSKGADGILMNKCTDAVLVLWHYDFTSGFDNGTLIHEITHASIRIGYKLGFRKAYECEEFFAFYSDYVVNKLYTKMWDEYLKKKVDKSKK